MLRWKPGGTMKRIFKFFLSPDASIPAGVLTALFCMSPVGQLIAIYAILSIIGIPLAVVITLTPALVTIRILAQLLHLGQARLQLGTALPWLAYLALSLGLLALPSLSANRIHAQRVAALQAGDRTQPFEAKRANTLAIAYMSSAKGVGSCDEVCQRLLLNRQADKVIVVGLGSGKKEPPVLDPNTEGQAFWWEEGLNCEARKLAGRPRDLGPLEPDSGLYARQPADLVRLKVARGNCLATSTITLAEADAVVLHGGVARGASAMQAGLNPWVDTVRAGRLAFYTKAEGGFDLVYQRTFTATSKLLPLTLPFVHYGGSFQTAAGLLRRTVYTGEASRQSLVPALGAFLESQLGLKLALSAEDSGEDLRDTLAEIVSQDSPLSEAQFAVVEDFFDDLRRRKLLSGDDLKLSLQILRNPNIRVATYAATAVRKLPKSDLGLVQQFADTLTARMENFEPNPEPSYLPSRYKELEAISNAISALPEATLADSEPAYAALEALAKDPVARVFGYQALKRLADFGEKGVPTLLYLIADAADYRARQDGKRFKQTVPHQWQHPYLAGLQGLCELASQGYSSEATVSQLYDWLDDGTLSTFGSYYGLIINTLFALGEDPDKIWAALESTQENRERFDQEIFRSKKQVDCGY